MNPQRVSQDLDRIEGWVRTTSLDTAHVTAGKSALVGKSLLRQARRLSQRLPSGRRAQEPDHRTRGGGAAR